jgi:uncharacterized repeat protein (TIGR03806 family)
MISCNRDDDREIEIPDFNFPTTVNFEDSLSEYYIFRGQASDLMPNHGYEVLELNSILFTDYAHKQRLVKLPTGTQMTRSSDGSLVFPDGSILTKTFYYYYDERDISQGKRIIETRLLIKENNIWNAATYVWNEDQTEALLKLDGISTQVNWTDADGINRSTLYQVPNENDCMACHQKNNKMTPLGPTLRNLNREVVRGQVQLNQISYLQSTGYLSSFPITHVSTIVDYHDQSLSLEERARAYLDMNCSHCHNPYSWERPAELEFDFRYETPLEQTGLFYEEEKIKRALLDREMPLIGTTMLDEEGIKLVIDYIESL